jgi:hypothetical protein
MNRVVWELSEAGVKHITPILDELDDIGDSARYIQDNWRRAPLTCAVVWQRVQEQIRALATKLGAEVSP